MTMDIRFQSRIGTTAMETNNPSPPVVASRNAVQVSAES